MRNSQRHRIHDFGDEAPRWRCTMRGCRKVISLREAQIMVCDEHAIPIWEYVQRYKNQPEIIEAAATRYELKVTTEAMIDQRKRLENNPTKADLALYEARLYPEALEPVEYDPEEDKFDEIYYLRQGGLIKIGYSSRLYDRLYSYGPTAEVLAHHPGTRADERDLHRGFRPFLARGREWYEPAGVLMDHIASVIETHGEPECVPVWTTPKAAPHSTRRSAQAKPNGLSI